MFGDSLFFVGFDDDFDFSARLELYFFAVRVFESVFNANFAIKMVGALNGDFGFLRLARILGLDDFADGSWLLGFWSLSHRYPVAAWT